jgi:hypothetical protein
MILSGPVFGDRNLWVYFKALCAKSELDFSKGLSIFYFSFCSSFCLTVEAINTIQTCFYCYMTDITKSEGALGKTHIHAYHTTSRGYRTDRLKN